MKSKLVKLNKKDFEVEIEGKKMYQIAGVFYCKKCCYRLTPQVLKKRKGIVDSSDIYLDISCLCDSLK